MRIADVTDSRSSDSVILLGIIGSRKPLEDLQSQQVEFPAVREQNEEAF